MQKQVNKALEFSVWQLFGVFIETRSLRPTSSQVFTSVTRTTAARATFRRKAASVETI